LALIKSPPALLIISLAFYLEIPPSSLTSIDSVFTTSNDGSSSSPSSLFFFKSGSTLLLEMIEEQIFKCFVCESSVNYLPQ